MSWRCFRRNILGEKVFLIADFPSACFCGGKVSDTNSRALWKDLRPWTLITIISSHRLKPLWAQRLLPFSSSRPDSLSALMWVFSLCGRSNQLCAGSHWAPFSPGERRCSRWFVVLFRGGRSDEGLFAPRDSWQKVRNSQWGFCLNKLVFSCLSSSAAETQRGIICGEHSGNSWDYVYVLIFSFAKFRFYIWATFATQIQSAEAFSWECWQHFVSFEWGEREKTGLDAHRAPPSSTLPPPWSGCRRIRFRPASYLRQQSFSGEAALIKSLVKADWPQGWQGRRRARLGQPESVIKFIPIPQTHGGGVEEGMAKDQRCCQ